MNEKWKVLSRETVYSAKPYLEVYKECVETSRNQIIDDFYTLNLRSFALCIPVLPNGEILTIRQYKHGPQEVSLTFPAGHIEEGEEASLACKRELLEETGYKCGRLVSLGSFVDNGNQRSCIGNYFIAFDCSEQQAPQSGDLEEMVIEIHTQKQIEHAMATGNIMIAHHALGWLLARQYLEINGINPEISI